MLKPRLRQRILCSTLLVALMASVGLMATSSIAVSQADMLVNGDFENGFRHVDGCGSVAEGWNCFTNGGNISYGFYDDRWAPVVAHGSHSQLIELNTMSVAASEADRFAGISQNVQLVTGATYTFSVKGLMRERGASFSMDPFRYRVQWGYTPWPDADWTEVTNWQELPWDKIDERTTPTGMQSHTDALTAPTDTITLFLRVWKKWGTTHKELDVNLDAIHLYGASAMSGVSLERPMPTHPAEPVVCGGPNLLVNGGFEEGFAAGVGSGWTAFVSGGSAAYGFYDEMWAPVISEGRHSQLIEINTRGYAASESDRVAGIYQLVPGLEPGVAYRLSLAGMLREEAAHDGEDPYRYRVQWGVVPAAQGATATTDIKTWHDVPWNKYDLRIAPGIMSIHSETFTAPSSSVVLAVRVWKKWATTGREVDVNLDAVSLTGCNPAQAPEPAVEVETADPGACEHLVVPGDTLGRIALKYGTSTAVLIRLNLLDNPNLLLPGQLLSLPCRQPTEDQLPVLPDREASDAPVLAGCESAYRVGIGDTLYTIASANHTTIARIMIRNRLPNSNVIYTGQILCLDE